MDDSFLSQLFPTRVPDITNMTILDKDKEFYDSKLTIKKYARKQTYKKERS